MRNHTATMRAVLFAVVLLLCASTAASDVRGVDWVVLVDCTGTMRYHGRGTSTVEGIEEFVSLTESGDRVSVIGYGQWTSLALPHSPVMITDEASREYVRTNTDLRFVADRTDITRGLDYVWSERTRLFPGLAGGTGTRSDAVVVLLTDGKLIPVYDDFTYYQEVYNKSRKRLLEVASLCGENGIRVCTIALGREEKVDGELMRTIAERTGGTYRHVASSPDVVEAYREIAAEQRPAAFVEPVLVETPAADDSDGGGGSWLNVQDVASASDEPRGPSTEREAVARSKAYSSSAITAFPTDLCLSSAGVLAAFIGLVAVGHGKRQQWAARLSVPAFGTKEKRVRGYLKPVDSPGMNSARANVGLENPGVSTIKVGSGTKLLPHLQTTMRFLGTTDGTPPELHVLNGQVTIEGESVTIKKLTDGDILEFDGMLYQYLRGNRR